MNCKSCPCRFDDGGLFHLSFECMECNGKFDFLEEDFRSEAPRGQYGTSQVYKNFGSKAPRGDTGQVTPFLQR